jgi:hypothetical protein
MMSTRSPLDSAIRGFTWCAVFGGAIFVGALVCGILHAIPAGGAVGFAGGGLLLLAVGVREVTRGRRLREERRETRQGGAQREERDR